MNQLSIENALVALKKRLEEEQQVVREVYQRDLDIKVLQQQLAAKEDQLIAQTGRLKEAMDSFRADCKALDAEQFNIQISYKKEIEPELTDEFIQAVNSFLEFCIAKRDALIHKFEPLIATKKEKPAEANENDEDRQSIASSNESGSQLNLTAQTANLFLGFVTQLQLLIDQDKYRLAGEHIKKFIKTEKEVLKLEGETKPTKGVMEPKGIYAQRMMWYQKKQLTAAAYRPFVTISKQTRVLELFKQQPVLKKVSDVKVENDFKSFIDHLENFFSLYGDDSETYIRAVSIVKAFISPPLDTPTAVWDAAVAKGRQIWSQIKREETFDIKPIKQIEEKYALLENHNTLEAHQKARAICLDDIRQKEDQQQVALGAEIGDLASIEELRKTTLIREVEAAIKERLNKGNYSFWESTRCYGDRGRAYATSLLRQIHQAQSYAAACSILINYIDGQIHTERRLKGNQLRYRDKSLSTYLLTHLFNGIYATKPGVVESAHDSHEWLSRVDDDQAPRSIETIAIVNTISAPTRAYGCSIFAYRKQAAPACRVTAMAALRDILDLQAQNARPTTSV